MDRRRRQICFLVVSEPLEPRWLLSAIPLPAIPSKVFDITSYGAVDTSSDNTTAIQNCINAASAAGGGIVEIPAAAQDWECGPLTLASHVDFQVDAGATLQMLPFGTYPLPTGATSYPNFIEANGINNVEISGSGTIDGNGSPWWTAFNNGSLTVTRPQMIAINNCNIILIQGLTLQNPPNTHISLQNNCNDATVRNITINTPSTSPNTDGIDVSGTNMLFENLNISDGDDNIALGAGANPPGSTPETENITITNCIFGFGHGLSIGSYTPGGVANVAVSNCTFTNTTSGIRMKSERGRGGVVDNISYYNITMSNVEYAIDINSYYNQGSVPTTPTDPAQDVPETPVWENITISNLTSVTSSSQSNYSGSYCGIIWGLPESPVNGVTLSNVQLSARYGMDLDHVRAVTFDSKCKITPLGGGGAEISTDNGAAPDLPYDAVVLGADFSGQDLGSPTTASSPLYNPNTNQWSTVAGATGIGGASDQFNFVDTPISGNATYFAKVLSLTNSNAGAQAGVMFRDSSDTATSAFAGVFVTPSDGVEFEWRASNGATAPSPTVVTGISAPIWVELVRNGSSFSAFYSSNGTTWTQIGVAETVTMSASALAGMAAAADSSSATTTADFSNLAGPTITTAPASSPQPATGTTANLSVAASESGSTLTYTWSILSSPSGVTSPIFSINGTSAAQSTTATFHGFGIYEFLVTITDSNNISTTDVLGVGVNQTPTTVTVSPSSVWLAGAATEVFTATATDQFGATFVPVFAWSLASGIGAQNSSFGLYTAPDASGSATVEATAGSASGLATITVGPAVSTAAAVSSNPVIGNSVALSVLGSENGSGSGLTYTWSYTGPSGVTYTGATNGTDAAQNITANFTQPGNYDFTATIADPGGASTTSGVAVVVADFAVQSGSTLNINLGTAGPVTLTAGGGNITASQNGLQATFSGITSVTVTDFGTGDVLNLNSPISAPFTFTNTGSSTVNVNSGTLTFAADMGGTVGIGNLSIAAGASAAITATTTNNRTTLVLNALSIGSGSSLDVANNQILINYGSGSDPIDTIAAWIASGYAGGSWNGPGIISTVAQANPNYGLGYADAADPNNPANLPVGQIKIMYTLLGDANLDGAVNGADFTIMAANFNQSVTAGWDEGDFNYDGAVNGADFTALADNFNQSAQIAAPAIATDSSQAVTNSPSADTAASSPTQDNIIEIPRKGVRHGRR